MLRSLPRPARVAILSLSLIWAAGTLLSVLWEVRLPATDVFLFKEAGVNLATKGRFVAANLPHMPPDQELVFSYYPPVFPFAFGLWCKAFGVGLRQSILFDCLLKALRTALMILLVAPQIGEILKSRFSEKVGIACLSLFAMIAFLSTDGDRPDELAIVFGLAAWYFANGPAKKIWRFGVAGALLGLCGATSPAAGVFFGLGFLFRIAFRQIKVVPFIAVGISAVAVFVASNLPVQLADREAFGRFSKQVPLSTIPYKIPWVHGNSLADFYRSLQSPWQHLSEIGLPYLFCALVLAAALAVLWWKKEPELRSNFASYFWAPLFFIPLSVAVWSLQPFYLWFACLGLLVALFASLPKNVRAAKIFVAVAFIAFAPISFREVKGWAHAFERGGSTEIVGVRKTLEALVPPGARVAVTSDQFFTLKGDRKVSNVAYVCERLNDYDFVYVTPVTSSSRTRPNPFTFPCAEKQSCFSVVQDLTTRRVFKIFGFETPYYVRDNGGVLYKNTGCARRSVAKDK